MPANLTGARASLLAVMKMHRFTSSHLCEVPEGAPAEEELLILPCSGILHSSASQQGPPETYCQTFEIRLLKVWSGGSALAGVLHGSGSESSDGWASPLAEISAAAWGMTSQMTSGGRECASKQSFVEDFTRFFVLFCFSCSCCRVGNAAPKWDHDKIWMTETVIALVLSGWTTRGSLRERVVTLIRFNAMLFKAQWD